MRGFNNLGGSTDSNWIFDASAFQNDGNRLNSLDPTEKYNFNGDPMNSRGSDSIQENFIKLKNKNRKTSNRMMISIPSNYEGLDNKYSVSPRMGNEEDKFPFGIKKGHVSALSGMVSREDNPSNLLFSINESIRKNVSARPRKKKTKKVEEEIIDDLFSNKREPGQFGDISNLSAIRRKKPPRKKMRKRRSAFKGINPNQIYQDLERMKTNQQEKLDLQSRIIDNSCQITKKGKADIEKMVKLHKTKTSMIYSEIDSANTDELADTVKPLDFGGNKDDVIDQRKLTFGFKMTNDLMKNGKLDMEEFQKQFLDNSQLRNEIKQGLDDNFQETMNKSDMPKLKKKKKKKKTGSMRVVKVEKKTKKKKKVEKNNIKKRKNSKKNINKSKKNLKSKRKLLNKKKNYNVSSRANLDKVISRYGIPLLAKKETKADKANTSKNVTNSKLSESKSRFTKKKRHSILDKSTSELRSKNKSIKGKKKIKAKSFKGMEKLREQSKFDSEKESKEKNSKIRSKKKKISMHKKKKKNQENPLDKFGLHLVESETLQSEDGDNILIKGLKRNLKMGENNGKMKNKHQNKVIEEYNMDRKDHKNSFIDKDLIDQLRNEPSSDEEELMKGIFSKESNIINGINPSLLKKSIQPKNRKDNTVINLNYSGDSDGFIDGNISEHYMTDEEDNKEMKDYLINGSKINSESIRHTSLGQDLRKREVLEKKMMEERKKKEKKKRDKETNDPKKKDISQIMSGLKNQLSLIESNGGLTGYKHQNTNVKKVIEKIN